MPLFPPTLDAELVFSICLVEVFFLLLRLLFFFLLPDGWEELAVYTKLTFDDGAKALVVVVVGAS